MNTIYMNNCISKMYKIKFYCIINNSLNFVNNFL